MTLIVTKSKKGKNSTRTHRGADVWTKAFKAWDDAARRGEKVDLHIGNK